MQSIIQKIKKRKKASVRVSFYLSKKNYNKFKELCGDVSVSSIISEWMRSQTENKQV